MKSLRESFKKSLHDLRNGILFGFAITVWCTFFALIALFYLFIAPEGCSAYRFWPTAISSATIFTIPLLWCAPRFRWTLWCVLALLTLFFESNLVYERNFSTLMPLNSVFQIKNMNGMVWESAIFTCCWTDLWLLCPGSALGILWLTVFRKRLKGKRYSRKSAIAGTAAGISIWVCAQICSTSAYEAQNPYPDPERGSGFVHDMHTKLRGKIMNRLHYLYYNGLDAYLVWSAGDFFPQISLDQKDRKLIADFIRAQTDMDAAHPIKVQRQDSVQRRVPNLLVIMVESFENWPLEYHINGKPALPLLDSLIKTPGTLYFPHLISQVSVGHSSDGHLIDLTGVLPLRESAAVTDFYDNDYPSIFKAFHEKYGGHTFEIISDEPSMWNQSETFRHYGFEKLYDYSDIDPAHQTRWITRDRFLTDFTAGFLKGTPTPFAGMAVTISLHTPYRATIAGYPEIDSADIDPQSIHYLKVCRMDETYICKMLDALKRRGILDQTVVVITGDHHAHSLFDGVRPPEIAGKEKFIPLIVLNTGFKTHTFPEPAGQIDIYPTLLDILGLEDYKWRGVGLSLLRHTPGGATLRTGETVGTVSADERERQNRAWDVSDLLIRSNYLSNI